MSASTVEWGEDRGHAEACPYKGGEAERVHFGTVPIWDGRGYTPPFFCKSVEVVKNEGVAGVWKMGVRKAFRV
jgi:hypothetical protein